MHELSFSLQYPDAKVKCVAIVPNRTLTKEQKSSFASLPKLMTELWQKIALDDQQSIASHWNTHGEGLVVSLEEPWMSHGSAFARTENLGRLIKVEWKSIRQFPKHAVISLLAHEFAHVYQFAVRKTRFDLTIGDFQGTIFERDVINMMGPTGKVELHADETIERWGFDYLAWGQWLHQNVACDLDGEWKEDKDGHLLLRRNPLLEKTARRRAQLQKQAIYLEDMTLPQ